MRSSVSRAFIKMTVLIIEKAWLLIMVIMKLMKILKRGLDGLAIGRVDALVMRQLKID